jgi:hypothetical protein
MPLYSENLIIRGSYFVDGIQTKKDFADLRERIIDYMNEEYFQHLTFLSYFQKINFFSLSFEVKRLTEQKVFFRDKLLAFINNLWPLFPHVSAEQAAHFRRLASTRSDYPVLVDIIISPYVHDKKQGLLMEISVTPAVYLMITQLHQIIPLDNSSLSFLVRPSIELARKIGHAIGGLEISSPRPMKTKLETKLEEKMKYYQISDDIIDHYVSAVQKLNLGKTKECCDDLKYLVENFVREINLKTNNKCELQHKFSENVNYLTEKIFDLDMARTIKLHVEKSYAYVSGVSHGNIKEPDAIHLSYVLGDIENFIDFCLVLFIKNRLYKK